MIPLKKHLSDRNLIVPIVTDPVPDHPPVQAVHCTGVLGPDIMYIKNQSNIK